jgi:hypothetical protein
MKKSKGKVKKTTARDSRGGESPEAVLVEVDKFVAARKTQVEKLTDKVIRAKKTNPTQHKELQRARQELSEALKLRVRVAKVVMDVEQRLRLIENSARFAIATAFAEYQQRTSRG